MAQWLCSYLCWTNHCQRMQWHWTWPSTTLSPPTGVMSQGTLSLRWWHGGHQLCSVSCTDQWPMQNIYLLYASRASLTSANEVLCCCGVENGSPYTFSVKPKWWMVIFWFFDTRSSAEAYLCMSPPRGHSTVGVPKCCEGFVVIWLRAREEFADNCFQLLFV